MRNIRPVLFVAIFSLLVALSQTQMRSQPPEAPRSIADRVTQQVDDAQTVRLGRNTRPEANFQE